MPAQGPIRVLIVDDSPLVRRTLNSLLAEQAGIKVVGAAIDGLDALVKIRALQPDVVTLDVMMPRLDGLKVLASVMRVEPVRVLMLSSLTLDGAEETLQALDLGAVDFIDKTALLAGDPGESGRELARKIRTASTANPVFLMRRPRAARATPAVVPAAAAGVVDAGLVVVGASTGGPPALQTVIPGLPGDLRAGVVIVQHIPAGFTTPLAGRIGAASAISVRVAMSGDLIRPGVALIAPAGRHLVFEARGAEPVVVLAEEPSRTLHRPSVDVTMTSAAQVFGKRCVGVLLTGMGADGAQGMAEIKSHGGHTIAESEESCVVYGMPRAAIESGAASEVAPLGAIAGRIVTAVGDGRR